MTITLLLHYISETNISTDLPAIRISKVIVIPYSPSLY